MVEKSIKENKVFIFSKSYCPYCNRVKKLFKDINVSYESIELDNIGSGDAIQDALTKKTGVRTVPQVFVGGQFVGGSDDTAAKLRNGQLKKLLEGAGIEAKI